MLTANRWTAWTPERQPIPTLQEEEGHDDAHHLG
jgi:hypothetical protein